VYILDLSTIEGLKFVDMVVQANDYIYVEPNPDVVRGIVAEIAPVLSTLSSVFIIITVIRNLK
jgi:polysaccharide export outer membrane protein